jgi:hypothetical protein
MSDRAAGKRDVSVMPKDVPNASNSIQARSSLFVQGRDSQIVGGRDYGGKVHWGHSDRARHNARWC